jgi:hypothetical protein
MASEAAARVAELAARFPADDTREAWQAPESRPAPHCWVEDGGETDRQRCGKPAEYVWDELYEPEPLFVCGDHARVLERPYDVFDAVRSSGVIVPRGNDAREQP